MLYYMPGLSVAHERLTADWDASAFARTVWMSRIGNHVVGVVVEVGTLEHTAFCHWSLLQNCLRLANKRQGTTLEAAEKLGISSETSGNRPSGAEALADSIGLTRGLKPPSPSAASFSAACLVVPQKAHSDSGFSRCGIANN
jgi:hypothetical protein